VTDQQQLFQPGCSLVDDASLGQRVEAAVGLILAEQPPLAERELLMLLAIAPAAWGAER
jgi:hypothetical protein